MMMTRHAFLVITLTIGALAAHAEVPVDGDLLDGVVAVVNGEVITLFDIERQVVQAEGSPGKAPESPAARRREALEQKIREILVVQQAAEVGISISDDEVNSHIERIKRENNLTAGQLEASLQRMGYDDMASYREVVRREMLKSHVVSIRVRSRLKVSDDEVQEELARQTFDGKEEAQIHCFHLMLRVDAFAPGEHHKAARERLEGVRQRILSGELSFDEAARTISDDVTKEDGGDLGWFTTGTLEDSFEDVAFSLKAGELSEVVQTPFGYHVIRVSERRRVPLTDERRQELVSSIRDRLYQDRFVKAMKRWFDELKGQAEIRMLMEL